MVKFLLNSYSLDDDDDDDDNNDDAVVLWKMQAPNVELWCVSIGFRMV